MVRPNRRISSRMNGFLKTTARAIVDKIAWSHLSEATLVLPTHRAGVTLKNEILQLQKEAVQAVYAPQITTIDKLFDALSPLYPEDELITVVRLYKHYRALSTDPMTLDLFYNWGRQMLSDFTNIDASMPAEEVPNFFDNVIAATELEQLDIDDELRERLQQLFDTRTYTSTRSVRAQYESLWHRLYELYQALRSEMQAEQKGYSGMRQRAVIEQWNETVVPKIQGRMFVFVGFNYLLPVEFELMQRLRDAGQALFFWDFVPDFHTNEKAFSFAQLNSAKLGNDGLKFEISNLKSQISNLDLISCPSRESQAQYVHQWLQDHYAPGTRLGVVICDESMLEPVIYALPAIQQPGQDTPAPINITKGFPLRNTQLFARTMQWVNDRANGEPDELVTIEWLDRLRAFLFPPKEEDPSTFNIQHSTLTWQDLLLNESEYQVYKIINQMRKIIADGIGDVPLTVKLVRLLLRRMMENVTMPFHGEPICDMQVLGVLETRTLDFDQLLLLHVEEGVVPQSKADISFIPYYLRKYYHMQTNDERATVYAYNFFRLVCGAGHTTMLFTPVGGVDGSKGMSRFVMQMLASPQFTVRKFRLVEPDTCSADSFIEPEKKNMVEGLHLATNAHGQWIYADDNRPYTLSPSALNSYIACPRAFYLDKIAKIVQPEQDEEAVLARSTFGSLVHGMMQLIYRQLGCDNESPVTITAEQLQPYTDETKLEQILVQAYEMLNASQRERGLNKTYLMADYCMDNPRIMQSVRYLLQHDLQTIEKEGLKIWQLEQWCFTDLALASGRIRIGGKIDRIDLCGYKSGNERIRIVDYKTGSYDESKLKADETELIDNPKKDYARQTMIYAHVLQQMLRKEGKEQPIEPHLFFCAKDMRDNPTVVTATLNKDKLTDKVEDLFRDTTFAPCAEGNCPAYCAFFDLCRRKRPEF